MKELLVYVKIVNSDGLAIVRPTDPIQSWVQYWVRYTPFMWDATSWFMCQSCRNAVFKKELVSTLVEIVGEEGNQYIIPLCPICAKKIGSEFKTNKVMLVEMGKPK